jgi:hypothetical protein
MENGRMHWNGRSEMEGRDVLSTVNNNWKREKRRRREGEEGRREEEKGKRKWISSRGGR